MPSKTRFYLGCLFSLLTVSACTSQPPVPLPPKTVTSASTQPNSTVNRPTPGETAVGGYPAIQPTSNQPSSAYPVPSTPQQPSASSAYPAPVATVADAFVLDVPLQVNQTQVSGRGPAGVKIYIIDVFLNGKVLGDGIIGTDNHFTVQVSPLPAKHRIGIMIADPGNTGKAETDYYQRQYRGPGFKIIPQMGTVMDTSMVQE